LLECLNFSSVVLAPFRHLGKQIISKKINPHLLRLPIVCIIFLHQTVNCLAVNRERKREEISVLIKNQQSWLGLQLKNKNKVQQWHMLFQKETKNHKIRFDE
jgi:hypothetical protein